MKEYELSTLLANPTSLLNQLESQRNAITDD